VWPESKETRVPRRSVIRLFTLALCSFALVAGLIPTTSAFAAEGVTYVVTSNDDSLGPPACVGTAIPGATLTCSTLREAIDEAGSNDNSPALDVITFDIGDGDVETPNVVETIDAAAGFAIREPMVIDGTTQTGDSMMPGIVVSGVHTPHAPDEAVIGLQLLEGSTGSTIQGLAVNGFNGSAMWIHSDDNTLITNFIGSDATGTTAVPNGVPDSTFGAVMVFGGHNTIGDYEGHPNLIVGNGGIGVVLAGPDSTDNRIVGNNIGVTYGGDALGNGRDGVYLNDAADANVVDGNYISDNDETGVIVVSTDATTIANNTIASNGAAGVAITSDSVGSGILGNEIFENGGLGIDLRDDGVTTNDDQDADDGPNHLINTPVLSNFEDFGEGDGSVDVSWDTQPFDQDFTIQIFGASSCDPTGYGEGEQLLDEIDSDTDAVGHFEESGYYLSSTGGYAFLTATVTDYASGGRNSSEFSKCLSLHPTSDVVDDLSLDVESHDSPNEDPHTTVAGWATLPESYLSLVGASIEAGQLEGSAGPSAAPLGRNPLGRNPLGRNPLGRNPLGRNPLGRNPLGRNPLGRNPVGINTTQPPLRGVLVSSLIKNALADPPLLTDLPTTHAGGWAALMGNNPEQSLTLNNALTAGALANVTIPEIDWSATKFADLSPAGWLLGGTRISDLATAAGTTSASLKAVMGCASLADSNTLLDAQWNRCDLTQLPWANIHLGAIPGFAATPLGQYKLDGVVLALTSLSETPATVLGSLNHCALAGCTLAQAQDVDPAGAIDHSAAVKDLGTALQTTTLEDLLPGLIDVSAFPYESMSVTQLIHAAVLSPVVVASQPQVTYTASFDVPCGSIRLDVTLHLPNDRFRIVPDSARMTTFNDSESATDLGDPSGPDTDPTWSLDDPTEGTGCEGGSVPVEVSVDAIPGPDVGDFGASFDVAPQVTTLDEGDGSVSASLDEPLHVVDGAETGNTTASASVIDANVLYTGTIGGNGDVDYFTMDVPAKSDTVAVYLSHVPSDEDLDLVMYGAASNDPPLRSADLTQHPLGRNPVDDGGGCLPADYVTMPQTLEDVPVLGGSFAVRSYSTNRSEQQEVVCTVGRETDSGKITIQVSGFNDAHGDHPYVLRALALGAPTQPTCSIPALANTGTALATPAPIPSSTRTLILMNADRFGDQYGATAEANTLTSLRTLAARPDVNGVILPIENNATVASAYGTLNSSPCSTSAANGVVRAINAYVDSIVSTKNLKQLRFVVLVGADNQIPFARIADLTQLGNQSEYQSDLRFNGNDNPASRAAAEGYFLSDDAYGSFHPIPWNGNRLYLPDVSVGRLVETPAQIQNQIAQYVAANGVLNPSSALVTGYDFTSDVAKAIADSVAGRGTATTRLIDFPNVTGDTWNRASLLNALNTGPRVIGINGHFDHFRTLTAGNDIATTADFAATNVPVGSLLFSLGCNAGQSIPNVWITGTNPATTDWAEALANKRSSAVLNSGFGYGDDTTIAYSEELMRLFAKNLDGSMSVGQAFAFAKSQYYGGLTAISSYDLKSMQESVFYGLPMQRYGTSGVIGAPSSATTATTFAATPGSFSVTSTTPDPDTGLDSVQVPISPFIDKVADVRHTPDGDYYVGPAVQETQFRPLEPTSGAFDMTFAGHKLHDAIVTSLKIEDLTGFNPVIERPLIDHDGPEPVVPDVAFPNDYVTTASAQTVLGPRDYLVASGGRFVSDPSNPTIGTQRIYKNETLRAYYSNSTDFTRPEIDSVQAVATGSTAFRVVVASNDVAALYAMYLPTGSDTFKLKALSSTDGLTWTGHVSDDATEWFVQAVDANGNVALSTFKGISYPVVSADDGGFPGTVTITGTGNGGAPVGEWYVDGATVTLENGSETFTATVDGEPTDTSPIPVSGDGAHVVDFLGDQGSSGSVIVPVDTEKPDIDYTIGQPKFGPTPTFVGPSTAINAIVSDGSSGVASCSVTGAGVASTTPASCVAGANAIHLTSASDGVKAINVQATDNVGHTRSSSLSVTLDSKAPTFGACPTITSSVLNGPGPTVSITATDVAGGSGLSHAASTLTATVDTSTVASSVTFTAVDNVGNTATKSCAAPVLYKFTGFQAPVDNPPTLNSAKTGSTVPFKWMITDANGVGVNDANSFVSFTVSAPISCAGTTDAIETYVTGAGLKSLGGGNWMYDWKPPASYAGQCRTITITLLDGTKHQAKFTFK
jgi:parallel beta-helix repeat protein